MATDGVSVSGKHDPKILHSPVAEIRVSIFVLWFLTAVVRGPRPLLSWWDINKPLMRGSGPRYTLSRSLQAVSAQNEVYSNVWMWEINVQQATQFTERSPRYCTAGMLHFINQRSSYKGWYINKGIYQNADSDSYIKELLNRQKWWHDSGNLSFSLKVIQEWFIARTDR